MTDSFWSSVAVLWDYLQETDGDALPWDRPEPYLAAWRRESVPFQRHPLDSTDIGEWACEVAHFVAVTRDGQARELALQVCRDDDAFPTSSPFGIRALRTCLLRPPRSPGAPEPAAEIQIEDVARWAGRDPLRWEAWRMMKYAAWGLGISAWTERCVCWSSLEEHPKRINAALARIHTVKPNPGMTAVEVEPAERGLQYLIVRRIPGEISREGGTTIWDRSYTFDFRRTIAAALRGLSLPEVLLGTLR